MTFCVQCMLESFVSSDGASVDGGVFADETPFDHFKRLHSDAASTYARRKVLDAEASRIGRRLQSEGKTIGENQVKRPPSIG